MSSEVLTTRTGISPRSSGALLAAAGIAFPLLFAVSFVFDATSMVGQIPRPGAPASQVVEFYRANQGGFAYVRSAVRLLAAACLAVFAVYAAHTARTRPPSPAWRHAAAVLGVVSALCFAASPALSIVANAGADSASAETLVALRNWNYQLGGTAHLATLGGFAAALTAGAWQRLSRPLQWVGVATAVFCLAAVLIEYANPLGRFVSWVWLIMLAVSALRGWRTAKAPNS